jgi:biotin-(acetyl-CoA carboxylase) ligase
VNVAGVPEGLAPDVAAATTAVDLHAKAPVKREALLAAFLTRLDGRLRSLKDAAGLAALERDYRARLALVGEPVRCLVGDVLRRGRLVDASLTRGLGLEAPGGRVEWLPAAHVRELRAEAGPA